VVAHRGVERAREAKVRDAQWACVRDKQVRGFHVAVQDVVPMHILCAFEELLHVEFDVAGLQLDAFVFQQTSEIVVHVGEYHVHGQGVLGITPDNKHIQKFHDTGMVQRLEDLDFSERGDGHAFLLIVHEDTL
jgi:hypothetical protein